MTPESFTDQFMRELNRISLPPEDAESYTDEERAEIQTMADQLLRDYNAPLFTKIVEQEEELLQLRLFRNELQSANNQLVEDNRKQRDLTARLMQGIKEAQKVLDESDSTFAERANNVLKQALTDTKLA